MYNVYDVANWFLKRDTMSPKKLQKLLYYAYAWTLTLQNEDVEQLDNKLFDEEFEAWVHGPVIRHVYDTYRDYGYHSIEKYQGAVVQFDEDVEDILNEVWEIYGAYTGNELESITHQESPWLNARKSYSPIERCNEVISDKDMFECYIERVEYEN